VNSKIVVFWLTGRLTWWVSNHLWNTGKFLWDYTALQPRKQPSTYSPLMRTSNPTTVNSTCILTKSTYPSCESDCTFKISPPSSSYCSKQSTILTSQWQDYKLTLTHSILSMKIRKRKRKLLSLRNGTYHTITINSYWWSYCIHII
jgi:hypothetical protein